MSVGSQSGVGLYMFLLFSQTSDENYLWTNDANTPAITVKDDWQVTFTKWPRNNEKPTSQRTETLHTATRLGVYQEANVF